MGALSRGGEAKLDVGNALDVVIAVDFFTPKQVTQATALHMPSRLLTSKAQR